MNATDYVSAIFISTMVAGVIVYILAPDKRNKRLGLGWIAGGASALLVMWFLNAPIFLHKVEKEIVIILVSLLLLFLRGLKRH